MLEKDLCGISYRVLLHFSGQLLEGRGRKEYTFLIKELFHKQKVALKVNREIAPGLQYALDLVMNLIFQKILGKRTGDVADAKVEADFKLLSIIFECELPNGELAANGIINQYNKLYMDNPSIRLKSLTGHMYDIIVLSRKIINAIIQL